MRPNRFPYRRIVPSDEEVFEVFYARDGLFECNLKKGTMIFKERKE